MRRRACLCCGYKTLKSLPGDYEICAVCHWGDDAMYYQPTAADPDYAGAANRISLNEAKVNFAKFGAREERFASAVRSPRADEAR